MKRLQNHIAESRIALPVTAVFALVVWIACGLFAQMWWAQFACFALSAYLMVVMNNYHALIRIYSRMVSCSFLVLSCVACHLFPDVKGSIVQLCVIASYMLLFSSYQDKRSSGYMYYAFLFLGLASCVFVQTFFFVPLLWLLITIYLNAMSWRTFLASLLGLLTPYWIAIPLMYYMQGNADMLMAHFAEMTHFQAFGSYSMTIQMLLTAGIVIVLAIIGISHYWRTSHNDKIRIRQLYGFFIVMTIFTTLSMLLQPQHGHVLTRLMIINTAPLIGHFFALTHTKWTNMAFCAIATVCLIATGINVWMSLLSF